MLHRFLLAPDKFKGTIEATRVCEILSEAIRSHIPHAEIRSVPMADGGEGMTRAYLSVLGGELHALSVQGPNGKNVDAEYGILPDGTAVMEMSSAAGLWRTEGKNNPLYATTYGVGELLLYLARNGIKKVLLGLGGSATNDCGIGMASALGWKFLDKNDNELPALAISLSKIETILPPREELPLQVIAACDVDNPLCGPMGATRVFGPQKGADPNMVELLEHGMQHFATALERDVLANVSDLRGAGAAGGMGAGVAAFLGGTLQPGIEMLLDAVQFNDLLKDVDLVITGEGRIDAQSAHGKVPAGVAQRAKRFGVPCIALCGSSADGADALYDCGVTAMFSAVRTVTTMEEISHTCEDDLRILVDNVIRLMMTHV